MTLSWLSWQIWDAGWPSLLILSMGSQQFLLFAVFALLGLRILCHGHVCLMSLSQFMQLCYVAFFRASSHYVQLYHFHVPTPRLLHSRSVASQLLAVQVTSILGKFRLHA